MEVVHNPEYHEGGPLGMPQLAAESYLQQFWKLLSQWIFNGVKWPLYSPITEVDPKQAGLLITAYVRLTITLRRPFVNFNRLIGSDAYAYPLKGVQAFFGDARLWHALQVVPPHFVISFVVYTMVWSLFFPLQFLIATIFGGPMGVVVAIMATVQQCHYYSSFITNRMLLPDQLESIFDSVLINNGHYDLVLRGRLRKITPVPFVTRFRRAMWSIPGQLVFYPIDLSKMVIPAVYNSIPLLGPMIFSMSNASQIGIRYQERYFKLRNLKPEHVRMLNKKRMGHYASFGFIAAMLEAIPILGFAFSISNTVGAALWCIDLENEMRAQEEYSLDRIDAIRGLLQVMK